MTTLTVRNIPEDAKHRLRQVAAAHGRSMEEHLRQLILEAGAAFAPSTGVRQTHASFRHSAVDTRAESRARIERLIALGRGLDDFVIPPREAETIRDLDLD